MSTLDYYNKQAELFVQNTRDVDFSETQNRFLSHLPKQAYILDFGCGSGRDTKVFLEHGFQVDATDGSEELCRSASKYTGIAVKCALFQELEETEKYDGIWACSSILHLSLSELPDVFIRMRDALKEQGVIYTSFKYGGFEGVRNGRYFTNLTEERLQNLLKQVSGLSIEEVWITGDVREGRGEEQWLNVILRKK